MAGESTPPPKESGGGLKYAILGLLLLGGAIVIAVLATGGEEERPVQAVPDAGTAERSTKLAEPELLIPELEPDAGPPPDAGVRTKIVYRYVRGDWECSGNIEPAAARAAIQENHRQVRNCYERRLKVNNTLQGNANVTLKIGADGRVQAVRVGGSLGDNDVFACIRQVANTWRFPAPQGGSCAVVSAPFNLTPRP